MYGGLTLMFVSKQFRLRSLPSQIWPALEKKASFPIFVVDVCDTPYKC